MRRFIRFLSFMLAVTLILCTVTMLFSCKDGDDDDGGTGDGGGGFDPYPYDDLSVYMDVPDYKNITLSETLVTRLVNTSLASFYREKEIDTEVIEGVAQTWDTVDIAFTGYIDGADFEGGHADSYYLTLGSKVFIDGFEDGILGMNVGETKDIYLKFPDDYGASEYAGKDVVFSVKVNHIYRAPELTDALCAQYTVFDTANEFKSWVRESCIFQYVWEYLLSQCKIKSYPIEYTEYYQGFKSYFQSLAEQNGMSFSDYISSYGALHSDYGLFSGMSVADFEEVATNYSKSNLVNDLLTYSIVRLENIETSGEAYENAAAQLEREMGMTYAELTELAGEDDIIISVLNIRLCEVINGYVKIENN